MSRVTITQTWCQVLRAADACLLWLQHTSEDTKQTLTDLIQLLWGVQAVQDVLTHVQNLQLFIVACMTEVSSTRDHHGRRQL